MRIFVTGATGFVGRALVQRLQREGHQVAAWVRDPGAARARLGPEVHLVPVESGSVAMAAELSRCQAVVNLAGDPLFTGRWTAAKKQAIFRSRVDLTRDLVAALAQAAPRPKVLVSASAVGIYGDRGDQPLDEASPQGEGYLADLCRTWEAAAQGAEAFGVRVACMRIGIVLGSDGGALQQMAPIFRLGLGGPLGSGAQWMSWIHLDDLVELLARVVDDPCFRGALNATAPGPVTNREFARQLGAALARPAFLPAPAFAVRLLLGEASQVLLGGQRVLPTEARALGFSFRYPGLAEALAEVFSHQRSVVIGPARGVPASEYLSSRGATWHLHQELRINAPLEEVRAFFGRPENLGVVTPSWVGWSLVGEPPRGLGPGSEIRYGIRLGPLPLTWRTRIERQEPTMFSDAQLDGPYRSWLHEHRFERDGQGTRVIDDVYYSVGWGVLGRLVHALAVGPSLRAIFGYRHEAIGRRFRIVAGTSAPAPNVGVGARRPDLALAGTPT